MGFLQNCKVCFKEESLPITYHNFHHKVWADLKVKLTRISTHKLQSYFFTERSDAPRRSKKKKENLPNIWEKTNVRPLFTP